MCASWLRQFFMHNLQCLHFRPSFENLPLDNLAPRYAAIGCEFTWMAEEKKNRMDGCPVRWSRLLILALIYIILISYLCFYIPVFFFVISLCVYMARENNAPMEKIQYCTVSPHIETVHCGLLWNFFVCYFALLCFLFLYFHFAERKKICVGWLCCTQSSPSDPPLKSPLSALCCSLAHKIGEILQCIQFYIGNFGQIWY